MLGLCFGVQMIAAALGSNVFPGPVMEAGIHPITSHDRALEVPLHHLIDVPTVRCGHSSSRNSIRCCLPASSRRLRPPIGREPALPVARNRCDHFTALATLTPNVAATSKARAFTPGLLPSQQLQSQSNQLGIPLSSQSIQQSL